jgi:phosphopantothenoylcysteine synthetase/decarboxylase
MNCVVTAGPTCEHLDSVRRLINFSTGRLGTQLANHLAAHGHHVILLRGEHCSYSEPLRVAETRTFSTTASLAESLRSLASAGVDAIFHAAAVSDFKFGQLWERDSAGNLIPASGGKVSTRSGTLLAELVPTEKILPQLRKWHPQVCIVGWKYEVDGAREDALSRGRRQLTEARVNACVINGTAYGAGFGLMTGADSIRHLANTDELFPALESFASQHHAANSARA